MTSSSKKGEHIYLELENKVKRDKWSLRMIEKGTLNDKVSAMQSLILDNPSYCLKYL